MYKRIVLFKLMLISSSLLPVNNSFAQSEAEAYSGVTESRLMFQENCEVCHGRDLTGGPQGVSLTVELAHGQSMDEVIASITEGYTETGMPAWRDHLAPIEIRGLAMYILETKENVDYVTSNYDAPMEIPNKVFETSLHNFQLKPVVKDLDPLPFSIAALPDGSLLLAEKTKGLRIISPIGEKSDFISGTPRAYDDIYRLDSRIDIERGMGWLFDVALHPRYEENGWIYLYHSHRCNGCNELVERAAPVSMNRLLRGRIKDGAWVDQEIIWQAPFEDYFFAGDVGAGGRIAFDNRGHVYFTLG
jgi:mono/diheme cytochrome c family protein